MITDPDPATIDATLERTEREPFAVYPGDIQLLARAVRDLRAQVAALTVERDHWMDARRTAVAGGDILAVQRDAAIKERDEARETMDKVADWCQRSMDEGIAKVMTCVWCGHTAPQTDGVDQREWSRAHTLECDKHPLRARATRLASALREACDEWESLVREFETQRKDRHTEADTRTIAALRAIADGGAL